MFVTCIIRICMCTYDIRVWSDDVSTDDILPYFVFVLIQVSPKHLYANLDYMQHFKPAKTSPRIDVVLVHLHAATHYLMVTAQTRQDKCTSRAKPILYIYIYIYIYIY